MAGNLSLLMKKYVPMLIGACAVAGALLLPAKAQETSPDTQALVISLRQQTAAFKAGQEALEAKLAVLEEEMRLTRIYSARSGRGGNAQ